MNKILILALIVIGFSNCKPKESAVEQQTEQLNQTTQEITPTSELKAPEKHIKPENRADLSFLLDMNDKYPYESNLFESEPMKTRLETIMGEKYLTFLQRMEVQTPILVKGNEVFMSGFMKHSGGEEEAALVVDISKNLIWVLTFENGKDLNIYKDDRDVRMPNLLLMKIKELTN